MQSAVFLLNKVYGIALHFGVRVDRQFSSYPWNTELKWVKTQMKCHRIFHQRKNDKKRKDNNIKKIQEYRAITTKHDQFVVATCTCLT